MLDWSRKWSSRFYQPYRWRESNHRLSTWILLHAEFRWPKYKHISDLWLKPIQRTRDRRRRIIWDVTSSVEWKFTYSTRATGKSLKHKQQREH
jgi:hypothetical protein